MPWDCFRTINSSIYKQPKQPKKRWHKLGCIYTQLFPLSSCDIGFTSASQLQPFLSLLSRVSSNAKWLRHGDWSLTICSSVVQRHLVSAQQTLVQGMYSESFQHFRESTYLLCWPHSVPMTASAAILKELQPLWILTIDRQRHS